MNWVGPRAYTASRARQAIGHVIDCLTAALTGAD